MQTAVEKRRSTNEDKIHRATAQALQDNEVESFNASHWIANFSKKVKGRSLSALYQAACRWKVEGKGFFGHGSWNAYLEKQHKVVPLDQGTWSNGRLHRTIAVLDRQHPIEQVNWASEKKQVLHSKSLNNLYELALMSNRGKKVGKEKFFNTGSWRAYIKWLRGQKQYSST